MRTIQAVFVPVFRVQGQFARISVELRGTTAAALCLFATGAAAQDLTWTADATADWNASDLNWELPSTVVTAFTDGATVTFGNVGVGTVTLDAGDVATPAITFAADGYTIDTTGGFAITPDAGSLVIGLDPNVTATIAAPLASLATDVVTLNGDPTTVLTLSGDSAGSLGTLDVGGGQVDLAGDYGGAVAVSGVTSDLDVDAAIGGDLDVEDGTTTVNLGGSVAGATTVVADGTLIANGGTFAGPTPADNGLITVEDGTVIVAADTGADIVNDGGEARVNAGQTLTGEVNNIAGDLTNLGTIAGLVTNTDSVFASGAFDGGIANAAGTVQVTGDSSGDVTNTGGDLIIDLGQTLTGNVSNDDAASSTTITGTLVGSVTVTDGLVQNDGTVDGASVVNGGQLVNTGTLDGTVLIDQTGAVAAELTDTGGLITGVVTNTDGTITADGTTFQSGVVQNGGMLNVSGADLGSGVTNAGGDVSVDGDSTGDVTNTGGDLTIVAGQTLTGAVSNDAAASTTTIEGTLQGALTVTDGLVENEGIVDGASVVNGGELVNTGTLDGTVLVDQTGAAAAELTDIGGTITGLVTNTDGAVFGNGTDFQAGVAQNGGTLNLTGSDLGTGVTNAGGEVFVLGDAPAVTTGTITNTGGDLTITAGQTLSGAVANNNAASTTTILGTLDGVLTVTDGLVDNDGTITGLLQVDGGRLENSADLDDGLTVTDGVVVNGGTVDGATVVNGGLLENTGTLDGTVLVDQTGAVPAALDDTGGTVTGLVTNTDGVITGDGTTFQSGVAQNGGTLTVTGADLGTGVANAGGSVVIDGAAPGTTTGDIINTGGDLTIAADQTLIGRVDNDNAASTTTIEGTLTGDLDVAAGTVSNNGTVTGAATVTEGTLQNTGILDGNVDLTRTVVARPTFESIGGTITGTLTNDDGEVIANGSTFTLGIVQNLGLTTLSGADLGTGLTNNGGLVTLDGATAATTVGDIENAGGDLVIADGQTLQGDVENNAPLSRIRNDGVIDGTVTLTDGALENGGVIDGNVDVTGANVFDDGGTVTGVVTQSGGTLEADGGTFTGGIDLSAAGTVAVVGDTTADIRNDGGFVNIDAGQTLTGDTTLTAGQVNNSGVLDGALTVSGGTATNFAGADISGLTTLQDGGTFDADGGTFTGGLRLEGGTLNVTGPIVGDVENAGDDLAFGAGQVIDGDLTNTTGTLSYAGTVLGDLNVLDGSVTTAGTTGILNETIVSGGTMQAAGGTFGGGITVDGGDVDVTADIASNGVRLNAGTLDVVTGVTVVGDLDVTDGVATLAGTLDGAIVQSGGLVTQNGDVAGGLGLSDGTFRHEGGTIAGASDVTGGTLFADGGDFNGQITNDGGTVEITGLSAGDLTNTAGTVVARAGGTLDGALGNAGTLVGDGGGLSGALVNSGTVDVIDGDLTVGSFSSTGDVNVSGGNQLAFETGNVQGGSLVVNNGVLDGRLSFQAGATVSASDMRVTGDLTSLTDISSNGAFVVGGDLALGAGVATFETGTADIAGIVTIGQNAGVDLRAGATLAAGSVINNGMVLAADGVAIDGDFLNNGMLRTDGSLSFGAGLRNSGTVDLVNGATDDELTIAGGDLSGGGTLRFDVDLSDAQGQSDRVTMAPGSFITGEVNLEFNVLGSGGQQATDILLIDLAAGDPGDFTINAQEIVDPSGILTYSVTQNNAGDVVIEDGLNPGIGGLAGNIVLTQSLIGSVVNRPSSPFVTTLAFDDVNPCGSGMWARAIAGGATSSGEVVQDGDRGRAFDGEISATFSGIQLGGDYACFNGAFSGWDIALGAIGGVNMGQTTQPVFAIDVNSADNLSALQTGRTDVDFTQFYTGVYASAVRGPLSFDLQYRFEDTDFEATNKGAGGLPGLGLDGTKFGSWATTLSGAASYVYSVPDTNLALVPTAGFAYTQVSTDPISFDGRGTVQINDFESKIGFIGGSLSQFSFGDDGVSSYRQFLSATIYNDFADGPRSTFSPIDNSGDRGLQTQNLGLYSEVSFGVNYVRVLQEDEFGAVKQFSANARADLRLSDRLESWGVTAQARFQF